MRSTKEIMSSVFNTYGHCGVGGLRRLMYRKRTPSGDAKTRTVSQLSIHYNIAVNYQGGLQVQPAPVASTGAIRKDLPSETQSARRGRGEHGEEEDRNRRCEI